MPEEKVLTKEIAEQFLKDPKSVELSLFTTIEDAAAENLSKYKGSLYLTGLSEISDIATYSSNLQKINERLAKCLINQKDMNVSGRIHHLHFPFLTELSETVAETLS